MMAIVHTYLPLDVGVFGPFKAMYNEECQTNMEKIPEVLLHGIRLLNLLTIITLNC